jgi:hypothetical protein
MDEHASPVYEGMYQVPEDIFGEAHDVYWLYHSCVFIVFLTGVDIANKPLIKYYLYIMKDEVHKIANVSTLCNTRATKG